MSNNGEGKKKLWNAINGLSEHVDYVVDVYNNNFIECKKDIADKTKYLTGRISKISSKQATTSLCVIGLGLATYFVAKEVSWLKRRVKKLELERDKYTKE